MFPLIFIIVFVFVFWTVWDNWKSKLDNRPPGPVKLPLIGNVLSLLPAVVDLSKIKQQFNLKVECFEKFLTPKPAYIMFDDLRKEYGPIMTIQFGQNNAVFVSSSEYSREILCREEFADRFADGWFLERQFGKHLGLIFNNGKPYKALKMFTMKHLKGFGLGRRENMEIAVEDELLGFLHDFQQKIEVEGSVVQIHHTFTLPVLNILWEMVAGIRFSYDDKKLHELIIIVEEISRTHDLGGNILMAFPWLRFIAPELTGHAHQMRLYKQLHQFFWDILHERLDEGSYSSGNPRDFVDVFLIEMEKQRCTYGAEADLLTEEQFVMVCLDLFTAGSETTANTLEFALLYVMLNPRVQKKIQDEIDEVIGQTRLPTMKDRQRMPFTDATLLETQRMCNVIPLVHRVATQDTNLGPYRIKTNDIMVINLHSIHNDEKVWNDPKVFRPERFLDDQGNVMNLSSFQPFGMGKRVCMGEVLAKHTLFTYFTSMMQRYTFQVPHEQSIPILSPVKGFTNSPHPFAAVVTPRNAC